MYYPCSENKGADQLRGHREADLRLCFRLCKLLVFSCTGSYKISSFVENNKIAPEKKNMEYFCCFSHNLYTDCISKTSLNVLHFKKDLNSLVFDL